MKLPRNTIWNQNNRGDRLGDIWSSKCLDLTSNFGKLRIAQRMLLNINTTDYAQLDAPPCAFRFFTTSSVGTWAVAGSFVWKATGGLNTTFSQDATGSTPTSCSSDASDMEQLGTNLFVTQQSTTVKYLDSGGTWNSATGSLGNSSGIHQMTKFRATNMIYIIDGNNTGVSSISGTTLDTSGANSLQNLVDGTFVKISWIASNSTRVWIGTVDQTGAPAKIYAWDGVQNSGPNEEYVLSSNGTLACGIKDDEPVVIDTRGRLLQRNGSTFVEFARLPFDEGETPITYFALPTQRMVHYNGLSVVKDRINILVNSQLYDTNSTTRENVPSGIWEWTNETGLYFKYALGQTKTGVSITDYGQQRISRVGALREIDTPSSSITQGTLNGKFICGARIYTSATATTDGIWYDDTADTHTKYGYVVTSWISATNIKETWQDAVLRIKKLLNSTDKIVVKYRTDEATALQVTGTWVSTSTFNTETDLRDYVGYEVEVLNGTGAGKCAHITTVADNGASGWLITVDDTFTGVTTGTMKCRVQQWTKCAAEFTSQTDSTPTFALLKAADSPFIQLKICVECSGKNEIFDIIFNTKKSE